MSLAFFPLVLLAGGLLAWLAGRWRDEAARWIALASTIAGLLLAIRAWVDAPAALSASRPFIADVSWPWIPRFGIRVHLGLDGLSLVLLALTFFLGAAAVLASWKGITERVGFFHFNLLWVLAGVATVFLAFDLFLFAFAWELMLVPMYFLIGIWGHEERARATLKFFVFTQAGGLFMLIAILGLVFAHRAATGVLTFDYFELLRTPLAPRAATWLMLGFLLAFLVKLPAVPFHTWLPDAHTEAPTAGSLVLAGLLLKTGAYGVLRFAIPLFPGAARGLAPVFMTLGAIGILYGAVLAFAQRDLKRMVAYTSVSHLGFVLLAAFAWNELALQGAVLQMVAHGLSTGALFVLVGFLYERTHTRDLDRLGGLWAVVPRFGAAAMFFAMASLGLPGLGNFVAEFLALAGAYRAGAAITVVATVGFVFATVYALWFVQKVFHGGNKADWAIADLRPHEAGVLLGLGLALVWLGLYPRPVLDAAGPALAGLQTLAAPLVAGR